MLTSGPFLELLSQRREKEQALELLTRSLAHDLRHLLAAAQTNLDLLRCCATEKEKKELYLRRAQKALDQMNEILEGLLAPASFHERPYELSRVVKEMAEPLLEGTPVKLVLDIPEDIVLPVVNRLEFTQILLNLLVNAREAFEREGTLYIGAKNVHHRGKPYFVLVVKDEGQGIPPEKIKEIFAPGYSSKKGHQGLGLAIVSSIVKAHEGWIEVESEPRIGTTFTIWLPAREDFPPRPEGREKGERAEDISLLIARAPSRRILVVDNDTDFARTLAEALSLKNYQVEVAGSFEEALRAYRLALEEKRPFEVIVTDYHLDDASGLELVSAIREINPRCRFIIFSGMRDPELEKRIVRSGAVFLAKPFHLEELEALL